MKENLKRYLAPTGLALASLLTGCSGNANKWKNSPGTKGMINLDAVRSAFQKYRKVADFEKRVNEIFEGDNLVVFSSDKIINGFSYKAYEDLNKDKAVGKGDDPLFTITVSGNTATLQGHGVNSYYKKSWLYRPAGSRRSDSYYTRSHYHHPHFHYWYWGRSWGGYYTPRDRYDSTRKHRDSYRRTTGFASQVKKNASFENKMAAKYGAGFRKAVNTGQSSVRKSHVASALSSGGFKKTMAASKNTSGWGMRARTGISSKASSTRAGTRSSSSSRSSGRAGGFGGFRSSSGFRV